MTRKSPVHNLYFAWVFDILRSLVYKLKEIKDPYAQERASKLDSATGVAEIKFSIADVANDNGGIRPNEEGPVIFNNEKNVDFHGEKNVKNWLDDLKSDWTELSKNLKKEGDIASS